MNHLIGRQEKSEVWWKTKIRMHSRATENYYERICEEMKELEEKKSKEALLLVQKKYTLWKYQNERDVARRLQRFGNTRRMKKKAHSQDLLSFGSCRSSVVDQVEEMSLEFPRKMQDEQQVMSGTAGKEMSGRREDAWILEAEGGNGDAGNQSGFERGGRRPRGP